jgi:orsellinic acid C2-O-methyltransferase
VAASSARDDTPSLRKIERLIPEDPARALPALLSDINMLVVTGGMERTTAEYGELLVAAGLRLGRSRR